ncbi:helix-turn-helix domain-containing protein [Pseudomonas alcaligenes]|jgi:DNA-binding transcriptional MerR regulator|uniref:helix-turn-helix domain-containing protein n=1 Tax=Aquipseudomonas alcaligenes TaxID=43263 RepID=UPI00358E0E05
MDIAEVARRSGLPASTLRFYEEKGLVQVLNRQGERRRFGPQILDQLALISLGQSAGFSLEEIRSMLTSNGEPNIDRQALLAKAAEIDASIKRLRAMSRGLRHAAACRAPSHAECPTFQRLLKDAAAAAHARKTGRKPGR